MLHGNRLHSPAVSVALAVGVGLGPRPPRHAQLGIVLELGQQALEVARRQLDVPVELGDVREGSPLRAFQPDVERPRRGGRGQPVLHAAALRLLGDVEDLQEADPLGQLREDLGCTVGGAVVDEHPPIRGSRLARHGVGHQLEVSGLVADR